MTQHQISVWLREEDEDSSESKFLCAVHPEDLENLVKAVKQWGVQGCAGEMVVGQFISDDRRGAGFEIVWAVQ